jgi:hypothetical protein
MRTCTEVCRPVWTGLVHRRGCDCRLGRGLGSSRIHRLPWSPLFLHPNIPLHKKSNPVTAADSSKTSTVRAEACC